MDINLTYDKTESEKLSVTIVPYEGNILDFKVSINSPLGKCLYRQAMGKDLSYEVGKTHIDVKVLKIHKKTH